MTEAARQLTLCNACRYCEGFCQVFTSLGQRPLLTEGDVEHLANLCHDCRGCFYACPFTPPHEFAINIPELMQEVRLSSYGIAKTADPTHATSAKAMAMAEPETLAIEKVFVGKRPVAVTFAVVMLVVVVLSLTTEGGNALWHTHAGAESPYRVVAYAAIVSLGVASLLLGFGTACFKTFCYWKRTRLRVSGQITWGVVSRSVNQAATLSGYQGGGPGCYFENERPSSPRRYLHSLMAYGFLLCLASTMSAAVEQDGFHIQPPYPWISIPVIFGVAGGIGLVIGCSGLIRVKQRSDPAPVNMSMVIRDYGMLVALDLLAVSGILTLALRTTELSAIVLVLHLATVITLFLMIPYGKLVHIGYRLVAITLDNAERAAKGAK